MRRHSPLGHQFGGQLRHRDVRLGIDPLEQDRQMRRQLAPTRRPALPSRLRRSRPRHPIGKLHRKAGADIVMASCRAPRLPAIDRGLDTLPEGQSNKTCPFMLASIPASILNQSSLILGNPLAIFPLDALRAPRKRIGSS